MRRLAVLQPHVELVGRPTRLDRRLPTLAIALDLRDSNVGETEEPGRLAHGPFRGLRREAVARAAPVARQVDATLEHGLDDRPSVRGLDPAVVDTVRERDDVSGEPVAPDVRRLPRPALLDLLAQRFVDRTAVPGAAAVVLAVRADEEDRVLDECAGDPEVEPDQVVVAFELEPAKLTAFLRRPCYEREQPLLAAALGPADEEDASVRQARALGAQIRLQLGAERRAVDGVVSPEAAVLDQDPRVDAARGRRERFRVGPRRLRAERPTRPGRGRSPARSRPPRRE